MKKFKFRFSFKKFIFRFWFKKLNIFRIQGNQCCAYGTSGFGSIGYDCLMIPGASTLTKNPAPNSFCGAAFLILGGSASNTFAQTQTVCSKYNRAILSYLASTFFNDSQDSCKSDKTLFDNFDFKSFLTHTGFLGFKGF